VSAANFLRSQTPSPAVQSSQSYKNGEKSGSLTFSRVFDDSVGQEQLFSETFLPVVSTAVREGQNGLLFAYGVCSELSAARLLPRQLLPSHDSSYSATLYQA
jgi:hypothetical protein